MLLGASARTGLGCRLLSECSLDQNFYLSISQKFSNPDASCPLWKKKNKSLSLLVIGENQTSKENRTYFNGSYFRTLLPWVSVGLAE